MLLRMMICESFTVAIWNATTTKTTTTTTVRNTIQLFNLFLNTKKQPQNIDSRAIEVSDRNNIKRNKYKKTLLKLVLKNLNLKKKLNKNNNKNVVSR